MEYFTRTINHTVYSQVVMPMNELQTILTVVKATKLSRRSGIAANYISLAANGKAWQNKRHVLNEKKLNDGLALIAEEFLTAELKEGIVAMQLKQMDFKLQAFYEVQMRDRFLACPSWMKHHTGNRSDFQYNKFTEQDIIELTQALHDYGEWLAGIHIDTSTYED